MRGKIDGQGFLKIYRGDANKDNYHHQYCPFCSDFDMSSTSPNIAATPCGNWCPHFGEPIKLFRGTKEFIEFLKASKEKVHCYDLSPWPEIPEKVIEETGQTKVSICNSKEFVFDEFTDERHL